MVALMSHDSTTTPPGAASHAALPAPRGPIGMLLKLFSSIWLGVTLLTLLCAEKDLGSLTAALAMGHDSDCVAATSGAMLGILLGYEGVGKRWQALVGGVPAFAGGAGYRPRGAWSFIASREETT